MSNRQNSNLSSLLCLTSLAKQHHPQTTTMKKISVLIAALILACTTYTQAQSTEQRVEKSTPTVADLFAKFDSNNDGYLAKEEVRGRLKKGFDKVDVNNDGLLTAEEVELAPRKEKRKQKEARQANADRGNNQERRSRERPSTKEIFAQLDTNADGLLAKAEVKGPLQQQFDTVDTNKDGFISAEELENAPRPQGRPGRGRQK